jgi:hypothetical protein
LERCKPTKRDQENLLSQIVGIIQIQCGFIAQASDQPRVPIVQIPEGCTVATQNFFNRFRIVLFAHKRLL